MSDEIKPNRDAETGVPFCSESDCPQYDGKRCRLMGSRPGNICEPAVIELVAVEAKQRVVCDEILSIMATYREQERTRGEIGTPGGLEHMGDVWSMLRRWEQALG